MKKSSDIQLWKECAPPESVRHFVDFEDLRIAVLRYAVQNTVVYKAMQLHFCFTKKNGAPYNDVLGMILPFLSRSVT